MLVGAVVIGGGAIAYFNYSGGGSSGAAQASIQKLASLKSVEYKLELTGKGNVGELAGEGAAMLPIGGGESDFKIVVDGKSIFDFGKGEATRNSLSLSVETDALGEAAVIGAEVRILDNKTYFKLGGLPESAGFLDMFVGQWIVLENNKDKCEAGDTDCTRVEAKNNIDASKLQAAIKKANIVKITGTVGKEEVEGVATTHYTFTIDKEGVRDMYKATLAADKSLTSEERSEVLAEMERALQNSELTNGNIWIDNDAIPRKISGDVVTKDEGKIVGEFSFVFTLKKFNQDVKIEAPTNTKTFDEIMGSMFGGLFGGNDMSPVFEDGVIDSDAIDISEFLPAGMDMSQFGR